MFLNNKLMPIICSGLESEMIKLYFLTLIEFNIVYDLVSSKRFTEFNCLLLAVDLVLDRDISTNLSYTFCIFQNFNLIFPSKKKL